VAFESSGDSMAAAVTLDSAGEHDEMNRPDEVT
jgi:hypothetical protein